MDNLFCLTVIRLMCCLGYFISLVRFLTQNSQKIAVMKKIAQKKTHKPNFFWKVLKNHINEIRSYEIGIRQGLSVLKENHSIFWILQLMAVYQKVPKTPLYYLWIYILWNLVASFSRYIFAFIDCRNHWNFTANVFPNRSALLLWYLFGNL